MADDGGRMEVNLDGSQPARPGPAKLGGPQLTIGQMLQDQTQQAPGPGQRKPLSPATVEGLVKRAEHIQAQEATPNPEDPTQPQPQAQPETSDPQLEPAPQTGEDLLFQDRVNPYDDPKMKEAIEARCTDLSFNSLLTNREIRQTVSIRPGELEVEFRSHTEGEEKFVRALLFAEGRDGTSADMFYTRQADYLLALNLATINGAPLSEHLTDGRIDEEKFRKKLQIIESYPAQLLGLLAINNTWFEERLRKLVTEGNIKNG